MTIDLSQKNLFLLGYWKINAGKYFLFSRSESNNGNDYPSATSYGGGNSNNSTLERSSYAKPASRSNSSNLFNLENNNDNNNLSTEPTSTNTSSR